MAKTERTVTPEEYVNWTLERFGRTFARATGAEYPETRLRLGRAALSMYLDCIAAGAEPEAIAIRNGITGRATVQRTQAP